MNFIEVASLLFDKDMVTQAVHEFKITHCFAKNQTPLATPALQVVSLRLILNLKIIIRL